MKSRIRWKRLSGSTRRKIDRLISKGWTPDSALSPFSTERHRWQEEIASPPVTAQDLALVEEARE